MELTASETTTLRYAGLSKGHTGTGAAEIKFAISLGAGWAEVPENALYKSNTPLFRITVKSGVVRFYKERCSTRARWRPPIHRW